MECIRSGFRDHVDDGSAGSSEFGIIIGCLDGHLLDRLRIGNFEALTRHGNVVIFGAIDQEIVGASAGTVDRECVIPESAAV